MVVSVPRTMLPNEFHKEVYQFLCYSTLQLAFQSFHPPTPPTVNFAIYADDHDIAPWCVSPSRSFAASSSVQWGINWTVHYVNKMGLTVSPSKTGSICDPPPRHLPAFRNKLFLNRQSIHQVHSHTYLELVVDDVVNWHPAMRSVLTSCQHLLRVPKCLSILHG